MTKTFRVLLTASASVHGYVEVKARNKEEARRLAQEKTGDVSWQYDGVDDSSVEAVQADPT